MSEIETITWRELTGNKFVRGIDPAMLTENGYVKRAAIRKIGDRRRTLFDIVYDREYLMRSLGRLICKPMFIVGKEKTLKLIAEAWDTYYQSEGYDCFLPEVDDDDYAKV